MNNILNYFIIFAQSPFGAGPDGKPSSGVFGFDWGEVLVAALTLIGTGIAGWWAYKSKQSVTIENQKTEFYNTILSEYSDLRKLYNDLQSKLSVLQNQIENLRDDLAFYEENHLATNSREMLSLILNSSDKPKWIHDIGQNKWYINDAYCKYYNISRKDFWTPLNILSRYKDLYSAQYIANDLSTIAIGTHVDFEEEANRDILNPHSKYRMRGVVRKHPFEINENNYIYGQLLEIIEDNILNESFL